jgi:hypothetical protein
MLSFQILRRCWEQVRQNQTSHPGFGYSKYTKTSKLEVTRSTIHSSKPINVGLLQRLTLYSTSTSDIVSPFTTPANLISHPSPDLTLKAQTTKIKNRLRHIRNALLTSIYLIFGIASLARHLGQCRYSKNSRAGLATGSEKLLFLQG